MSIDGSLVARRSEILDIASQVLAQKGYDQTSVREIGAACGILSGSLYHHFSSKEQIAFEIVAQFYEQLVRSERAIVRSSIPNADKLRDLMRLGYASIG